jgi:hypothetical protein
MQVSVSTGRLDREAVGAVVIRRLRDSDLGEGSQSRRSDPTEKSRWIRLATPREEAG